jgi:Uma2 family endonuclease
MGLMSGGRGTISPRKTESQVAAFTLAPDWVCEVLSPSTRAHDRVRKMPVYRKRFTRGVLGL